MAAFLPWVVEEAALAATGERLRAKFLREGDLLISARSQEEAAALLTLPGAPARRTCGAQRRSRPWRPPTGPSRAVRLRLTRGRRNFTTTTTTAGRRVEAAVRCFRRALQLDPRTHDLWLEFGTFSYMLNSHANRLLRQVSHQYES